ncbi:DUF2268 domain-containing putative Zn-dependent protease [Paenibacillus tarimensis]
MAQQLQCTSITGDRGSRHHNIRLSYEPWSPGTTVGQYLVLEGLAEAFDGATVFPDIDKWFSYVSFSDRKLPSSDYVVNILQVAQANEPVAEIIRVQYGTAKVRISEG